MVTVQSARSSRLTEMSISISITCSIICWMIRQQFPYLEESELYLQTVYDLAKTMTPVEEVPIMMELSPDEAMAMQLELQEPRSPYRHRYLKGLAETANELRINNIALAKVGSPGAYQSIMSQLSQIMANLS